MSDRAEQIRADLEVLYTSAREDFPNDAKLVSGAASVVGDAVTTVNQQSALSGDHLAVVHAAMLADSVFAGLQRLTKTLNSCAIGLEKVADDFVEVDDQARAAFAKLRLHLPAEAGPAASVPHAPVDPADPGAPGVDPADAPVGQPTGASW